MNVAAQTPWLAHQLQFVAGLGPRKAAAVLKGIQRQEQVASRRAVWKELKVIGKKVFWYVPVSSLGAASQHSALPRSIESSRNVCLVVWTGNTMVLFKSSLKLQLPTFLCSHLCRHECKLSQRVSWTPTDGRHLWQTAGLI